MLEPAGRAAATRRAYHTRIDTRPSWNRVLVMLEPCPRDAGTAGRRCFKAPGRQEKCWNQHTKMLEPTSTKATSVAMVLRPAVDFFAGTGYLQSCKHGVRMLEPLLTKARTGVFSFASIDEAVLKTTTGAAAVGCNRQQQKLHRRLILLRWLYGQISDLGGDSERAVHDAPVRRVLMARAAGRRKPSAATTGDGELQSWRGGATRSSDTSMATSCT